MCYLIQTRGRMGNMLQMHLKILQKTAEATGDLIGNKIADKI